MGVTMPTRRAWLGAAAALPPSWIAFQAALRAASPGESYWRLVKRQYALDDSIIYLGL
jgi:hypothetical protein